MTDRDHFAAAAFAGLLAQGDDGSFSEESYAVAAYRWADTLLRVRDSRTADTANHDAAPEARAVSGPPGNPVASAVTGTGDTPPPHATPTQGSVQGDGSVPRSGTENEPVAWGVMRVGGRLVSILNSAAQAETSRASFDKMENWVHEVVPLYLHPPCQDFSQKNLTLTDDEMTALRIVSSVFPSEKCAAALRALLERMGGER